MRNCTSQENGHFTVAKAARISWIVLVAYKNVAKIENDVTFSSISTYTIFSYKSVNNKNIAFYLKFRIFGISGLHVYDSEPVQRSIQKI